jgi:hypothetical protein
LQQQAVLQQRKLKALHIANSSTATTQLDGASYSAAAAAVTTVMTAKV